MKKVLPLILVLPFIIIGIFPEDNMNYLAQANTGFALDMYGLLCQDEGNIFYSPYSISTALAMTYAGACRNTEKEMAQVLHFGLPQEKIHSAFYELQSHLQRIQEEEPVILNIANALWTEKTYELKKEFLDLTKKYYDANIFPVDFRHDPDKSRIKINDWVEDKTEEKIKDLLGPDTINQLTRLVLTNAIYFFGEWEHTFNPKATRESIFWLDENKNVKIPMMYQESPFGYGVVDGIQVLEMPYKGDSLSMVVFLPEKKDGIKKLESSLSPENMKKWITVLRRQEVETYFPKFKMTQKFNLNDVLRSLGMKEAFTRTANYSNMEPNGELFISDVVHKAFVEVDEQGTEAAAATAVVMELAAMPMDTPVFKADHPFVFVIRERTTNSILFIGRLMDPTK